MVDNDRGDRTDLKKSIEIWQLHMVQFTTSSHHHVTITYHSSSPQCLDAAQQDVVMLDLFGDW